ncbi:flagellar motor switch protein FliG [Myxococcota bacterium]|nr:flagellar motor switch protein FliG [Myxococcota bacterium]
MMALQKVSPRGPEKAALFVLALGEELAAQVIQHLSEDEVKRLADCADHLKPEMIAQLDETFEEFERQMQAPMPMDPPGSFVRNVTTRALGPERASHIFGDPRPTAGALATIQAAPPKTIAELLREEHPQVATVILSLLPQEVAVGVIMAMPDEVQADLLARLATLAEVPRQIAEAASEALAKALSSAGAVGAGKDRHQFDGVSFTARLLNDLPREKATELLDALEQRNASAAPRVRRAMFTFEDLIRVQARDLQVLIRDVSSQQLAVALKTASEALREHIFSCISSRAAETMREDIAVMPPMRLSEVETAQREIVETALRLAGEGRVTLPSKTAGEKMV